MASHADFTTTTSTVDTAADDKDDDHWHHCCYHHNDDDNAFIHLCVGTFVTIITTLASAIYR